MFRYNFLGHLLAQLNEICCGSLLNSILKTYRRKLQQTLLYVSSFVCLLYVCKLFTAFEEAVLKVPDTLVRALKSKVAAISTETEAREFFSSICFTDHNKCTLK